MPVSRWLIDILEVLNWMEGGEAELENFLFQPTITQVTSGKEESENSGKDGLVEIPEILPVLPLRGVVVYPHIGVPLTIGQPRSITLVDDVVAGDRLVALVASRNPELETPGPDDLYQIELVES